MSNPLTIQVPATTANIGPGFDCIGAALSLYNRFQFTPLPDSASGCLSVQATGHGADQLPRDAKNLVYQAFVATYQLLGQPPPAIHLNIHLDIPQARGLGSSATAIVAGLMGANELAHRPLAPSDLVQLAIDLEGHPDNVVPALLGGCCLAAQDEAEAWQICTIDWSPEVVPIVAIPDFELKTDLARGALPKTCGYGDAIFNMAHLGLLIKGLETADPSLLKTALDDKLHQPYRLHLIPEYAAVRQAALNAGAYGLVISGAGPTLLALGDRASADAIANSLKNQWQQANITADSLVLAIDTRGAAIQLA